MRAYSLLYLIQSDLYRYGGKKGFLAFLRAMLLKPGFVYSFWFRVTTAVYHHKLLRILFFLPSFLMLRHYSYKFGIMIPFNTCIGPGLFIGHFTGVVVHPDAVIGKNLNISQGVTIGQSSRGEHEGVPVIGDNVYIAPGAKVIGRIRIGNDVAIGANSVVTKDVPDHGVVVGIPGKVISDQGSAGYVIHTDY